MFLPIRTDSSLRSTPWMNYILIGLNLLVFIAQTFSDSLSVELRLNPRDLSTINFLTYAFVHASWVHVLSNMLFLYIFGNNVNDKMGHVGYLGFYLSSAVVAGLSHVLASQSPGLASSAPVVGASGAVWAVTAAYLILFPRSNITIVYFFIFIGHVEVPSLFFVLLYFARDIMGFFGVTALVGQSNTAYAAHVGGAIFGAVTSFALLSIGLLPRDQFDVIALLRQWNRRRQYRDLVAQGYNPFSYGVSEERESMLPDRQAGRVHDLRAAISDAMSERDLTKAATLYLELCQIDPQQVLARQAQLDVANQLASMQKYAEAVDAYERFLQYYPKYEQIEEVELMLGLLYARYLKRYQSARTYLLRSLARLHNEREIHMARTELARIEPLIEKPSER